MAQSPQTAPGTGHRRWPDWGCRRFESAWCRPRQSPRTPTRTNLPGLPKKKRRKERLYTLSLGVGMQKKKWMTWTRILTFAVHSFVVLPRALSFLRGRVGVRAEAVLGGEAGPVVRADTAIVGPGRPASRNWRKEKPYFNFAWWAVGPQRPALKISRKLKRLQTKRHNLGWAQYFL